jgi:cobalt-zinc-cadmium efflux system outer membrane protein
MLKRLVRTAVVVCSSAVGAICAAQELVGAGPPLTLTEAVERTLGGNPDLQSFVFRLRAQDAREQEAALRAPLDLLVNVEDAFGTGRASGLDSAEATFALSHVLELGGQRSARVAAASAAADLIELERAAAQLDVLAEVTRRFIHVAADQAHLALTDVATDLARQTVDAAAARSAAGRAPEAELRRANVTLARTAVEREHAEHELRASRKKLAAMWGESELAFGRAEANLYQLPAVDGFEALLERLERNPDFVRFASEARLRDAELRLAATQARPRFALSAGLKRLEQTDDTALVFGVNVPVGNVRRAAPEIAAATARRAQTDAELHAHRVRVEAHIYELYQELLHAITEAEILDSTVIPEMRAALTATQDAFERGRYGYLEWVDAQRELIEVQRALIEAAANAHLYRAEIERLTAEPLSSAD